MLSLLRAFLNYVDYLLYLIYVLLESMGRTKVTLPQFIAACFDKGYQEGFKVLPWIEDLEWFYPYLLEIETPRYNKNFNPQFEEIHKVMYIMFSTMHFFWKSCNKILFFFHVIYK